LEKPVLRGNNTDELAAEIRRNVLIDGKGENRLPCADVVRGWTTRVQESGNVLRCRKNFREGRSVTPGERRGEEARPVKKERGS